MSRERAYVHLTSSGERRVVSAPAVPTQPGQELCSPVSPVPLVWEGLPLQGDLSGSSSGQWLCQGA